MDFPPERRVNGARALARAFVLQAEALTRNKNLTRPMYARLRLVDSNNVIAQVHALCRDTAWAIAEQEEPMPDRSEFAPLKNKFWTSQGDNGKDPPINVGIFNEEKDAAIWSRRQNESQRAKEWGRGQAGPMTFTPKPLYNDPQLTIGAPNPSRVIYSERQWTDEEGA
jgi:hypothetical protein